MQDKAVVLLKENRIVKIKNFTDPKFSMDGRVIGFLSNNGENYIYCEEIKLTDLGLDNIKALSEGYYNENLYLNFKNENSQANFSALVISYFDRNFINATENDKIQVKKFNFIAPYNDVKNLKTRNIYELNYRKNENYFQANGDLIEPENSNDIVPENLNLSEHARKFYFANIYNAIDTNDTSLQFKKAKIIARISINIHNILNLIFPLFNDVSFEELKNSQINFWEGKIFTISEENVLNDYLERIRSFYKIAYDNKYKLLTTNKEEKLFILAIGLSEKALSIFTPKNKIELLSKIYIKKLKKTDEQEIYENLVLKIISSFNDTDNQSINLFLEQLTTEIPDSNENKVLYQCLYESMSTSFIITEGIISIINKVFDTDFKPTKTKQQFVQIIYTLWYLSKYNPYELDGSYKQNTIALRSSSDLARITSNVNTNNYTYNYTNYIAFDPKYKTFTYDGTTFNAIIDFKLTRPDAAPIVIPYSTQKFLNIFWDDFTFKFKKSKIEVYQQLKPVVTTLDTVTPDPDDYITLHNLQVIDQLYGTYDIYQPVTLLNTNIESRSALSFENGENINLNGQKINSLIPIFVLAFLDQDSSRSNTEIMVGYIVDVVTTFAGFGNLTKLKHLKWASTGLSGAEVAFYSIDGIRIIVGGVEFSSGVLSFLGNFIECDENDKFCNGVKIFLNLLQLACLTVNAGDGITSLAAKRQARKLAEIANSNGSNPNTIDNLSQALGGTDAAKETAHTILQFADSASQFQSLNAIVDRVRDLLINAKTGLFKKAEDLTGKLQFTKNHYSVADMLEIVAHLNTKAEVFGPAFEKLSSHFLFIGSKTGKLISKDKMIRHITFFYDEVLKRGYPSGFNRTDKIFQVFCEKTRAYFNREFQFWDEDILGSAIYTLKNDPKYIQLIDKYWINYNFSNRVELIVQGSVLRKYKSGEILEHLNPNDFPLDNPGDFEFALRLKPDDFVIFTHIAQAYAKARKNSSFNFTKVSQKGFIKLDGIKDLLGEDFINELRKSIVNDINFDAHEIDFAIIKEGGPYDLEPFLNFKY
ncbi:hypothetical protein [Flavobacterium sp. 2]|uniref:hypothetical protein n=1 Tax=Flavobacterium sp. 2 TaxID=308053 RepID=UPI003CEE6270